MKKKLFKLIAQMIFHKKDVLHLCGADQSSPLLWPKLHTLNLSYNQLSFLDNSFVNLHDSSSIIAKYFIYCLKEVNTIT